MFGTDPVVKDLRDQVLKLRTTLETNNLTEFAEQYELAGEVVNLKKQVTELEIEKSKKEEDFAKQKREVEHKIGLERKRMEFEREEAAKNARLEVREENLKAQKDRFEDEMKFMRTRMEDEVDQLRDLLGKVMNMVPTVSVDRKINENYGDQPKALEGGKDES